MISIIFDVLEDMGYSRYECIDQCNENENSSLPGPLKNKFKNPNCTVVHGLENGKEKLFLQIKTASVLSSRLVLF